MLNLLKTIVTKLGGVDTAQSTHVDTFTEDKMNTIIGDKIAVSNRGGGIWIRHQELAGYKYINAVIVGEKDMKNFKGCSLTFFDNETEIVKLLSDTQEIESTFSNVSNRWLTEVSFDITDINVDFIKEHKYTQVKLEYKKKVEIFESFHYTIL